MTASFNPTSPLPLPPLGLGTAPLGNLYRPLSDAAARATCEAAWAAGIRLFDTAPHYGQGLAERRLGDALRSRDGYLLSTKVGRLLVPAGRSEERHAFVSPMPFDIRYDYSYAGIRRSFEDSLQRLGLDRIDIALVHDIGRLTHGDAHPRHLRELLNGGMRALAELKESGQIAAVGIGVNEIEVCMELLDQADLDCLLLAGRYTLLEQEAALQLLPRCQERGVQVILGGVYNSGILAQGSRAAEGQHYNYAAVPPDVMARVVALEEVCERFDLPLAAAALQFAGAHPAVASILLGLDQPERVAQTMQLQQQAIPRDFWLALQQQGLLSDAAVLPGAPS